MKDQKLFESQIFKAMIDSQILRILKYRSGDISYIMETGVHLNTTPPLSHYVEFWKNVPRKELWYRVKRMIAQGLINEVIEKEGATSKNRAVYELTDLGHFVLNDMENCYKHMFIRSA